MTDNVPFTVCQKKLQKLKCPAGYLINIISAEMIVTADSSCEPSQKTCSESATKTVAGLCAGKDACNVYASGTRLPTCEDKVADAWLIDFNCVPDATDG